MAARAVMEITTKNSSVSDARRLFGLLAGAGVFPCAARRSTTMLSSRQVYEVKRPYGSPVSGLPLIHLWPSLRHIGARVARCFVCPRGLAACRGDEHPSAGFNHQTPTGNLRLLQLMRRENAYLFRVDPARSGRAASVVLNELVMPALQLGASARRSPQAACCQRGRRMSCRSYESDSESRSSGGTALSTVVPENSTGFHRGISLDQEVGEGRNELIILKAFMRLP
ncbi:MAG: hypothetical protein AW10_01216 [Candidatus Accumulibacter appositus]|uniref:Uncharacterized protein n=1 Tax=Candidatus Accumulibacter appositus TaxID=1454003 RepID=A0A011PVV3_9PROT|nr:MAG: hypothetical protein AW10_01216 [Candidatus Accumulibacter appositus]